MKVERNSLENTNVENDNFLKAVAVKFEKAIDEVIAEGKTAGIEHENLDFSLNFRLREEQDDGSTDNYMISMGNDSTMLTALDMIAESFYTFLKEIESNVGKSEVIQAYAMLIENGKHAASIGDHLESMGELLKRVGALNHMMNHLFEEEGGLEGVKKQAAKEKAANAH